MYSVMRLHNILWHAADYWEKQESIAELHISCKYSSSLTEGADIYFLKNKPMDFKVPDSQVNRIGLLTWLISWLNMTCPTLFPRSNSIGMYWFVLLFRLASALAPMLILSVANWEGQKFSSTSCRRRCHIQSQWYAVKPLPILVVEKNSPRAQGERLPIRIDSTRQPYRWW